jgi:hypothetical protein
MLPFDSPLKNKKTIPGFTYPPGMVLVCLSLKVVSLEKHLPSPRDAHAEAPAAHVHACREPHCGLVGVSSESGDLHHVPFNPAYLLVY